MASTADFRWPDATTCATRVPGLSLDVQVVGLVLRNGDVRVGVGESALLDELLLSGAVLLTHGEILSVVVPHPSPTEDESHLQLTLVAGALAISSIDEREIGLAWYDPYTLHESESISEIAPDDDLLVMDALSRNPVRVDSWFAKQERLIDLIDGRSVVIERVDVRRYDWPVPGPVQDTLTPSYDLKKAIETLLAEHGFSVGEFAKSHRKRLGDNTELVAAITPESFVAEDSTRRHPLTVSLGVARRDLNRRCDWFSGRPDKPWRWTLQEQACFFSPECAAYWPSGTSIETVQADLGPALEEAERFAMDENSVHQYLWEDRGPIHTNLYQRMRLTSSVVQGWDDRAEHELAAWKQRTTSRNQVTVFEATLRRYLDTGKLPHWWKD